MQIDRTTLSDLSIFQTEDSVSVFEKLNLTVTVRGKQQLAAQLSEPLQSLSEIHSRQQYIQTIVSVAHKWPTQISNGTLMVIERFYETHVNPLPARPDKFSAWSYKIFNPTDFRLVRYSIVHCFDFLKGMQALYNVLWNDQLPKELSFQLSMIQELMDNDHLKILQSHTRAGDMSSAQMLYFAGFLKHRFKRSMFSLMEIYARIDAGYGLATAVKKYDLHFPEVALSETPYVEISELVHLLLNNPVPYTVSLNDKQNFLFLTGANMAGKSTFIKAVGIAVFLAHCGMAVPAKSMRISFSDGLLSNINVIDNIAKGESYFFNEVKRIKSTIEKISNHKKWFILIDELFKGTNVQDAMKCSKAVIEGLLKVKSSLFILSTHLYEISDALKTYPNIQFNYFETHVLNEQLSFTYQLKEGVSNDRLGYLILKREGVVDMLERL